MVLMETAGETIKHLLLILFLGPSERKGRRGGGKRPHPNLHKVVDLIYTPITEGIHPFFFQFRFTSPRPPSVDL